MKPVRVQLRRTKGWRMPPNTVKVDRTTRWGNPFKVQRDCTHVDAVKNHALLLSGLICLCRTPSVDEQRAYLDMMKRERESGFPSLRGKSLACWCRLGQPCHADILLILANHRGKRRPAVDLGELLRQREAA